MPEEKFSWEKLWEQNKAPIILGLVGILLVSVGILTTLFFISNMDLKLGLDIGGTGVVVLVQHDFW